MLSRWSIQLKYSLIFILTLVLIVAGLFIGIYTLKTNQLRNEAMASAEQVLAFRAWVANTGVVWADHLAPDFPDYLGKRASSDGTDLAIFLWTPGSLSGLPILEIPG